MVMKKYFHPAVEAFRGDDNLIRIVGHRGARGMVPENTMVGFRSAVAMGIKLIEFDVVLCADGFPVITHNHTTHAPTFKNSGGNFIEHELKVLDLTWLQLQKFEVGHLDRSTEYAKRFPDQLQFDDIKVPKLDELLNYVKSAAHDPIYLMLEIKSDPSYVNDKSFCKKLVSEVVQRVRDFGLTEHTLLHSFDWQVLEECRFLAPELPTSFLTQIGLNPTDVGEESSVNIGPNLKEFENNIPDMVKQKGGSLWCPYFQDVTPDNIASARDLDLVTAVWTVNLSDEIDRMIEFGVDAIITDYPGRVQQRLADYGYSW